MGLYIERGYNLVDAKQAIEAEIVAWYGGAALDTFDCNVLGPMHRYECNEAAQLRFINGKVSNSPIMLTCGQVPADPEQDPAWTLKSHSATECGKVHTAYTQFASAIDLQFSLYKQQAAAATTVAQVEDIFYSLWPQPH
jgi:hypothetical protein